MLVVHRTKTTCSDRSFTINGPSFSNNLPAELHSEDMSLDAFGKRLKIMLLMIVIIIMMIIIYKESNDKAAQVYAKYC